MCKIISSPRTIYIDANISTNGDGSASNPYKDFSSVNSMILYPGDRIYLKRGCIWNQQLTLNCQGNSSMFIEVGAYGDTTQPKPHIRLNGDITERCMRINNANYFRLSSIEVSNGGAGIVFFYDHSYNNHSVYVDDIVAHEFYGLYVGSGEYSSNPNWQSYRTENLDRVGFSYGIGFTGVEDTQNNQTRVLTDIKVTNCEIYKTGAGIALDWWDHHCVDGTAAGPNKFGNVILENINLHDNDVQDISLTSMFVQCCTNAIVENVTIDRGCYIAPRGTAAIHLQLSRNVIFRKVTIKNTPFTECPDNGGIDFETDNENTIIEECRFENIPGAAIMFLANPDVMLYHPDSKNVTIKNNEIIDCGYGDKYSICNVEPFSICVMMWPMGNKPTGEICNNIYKLPICETSGAIVPFFGGNGVLSGLDVFDNKADNE